MTKQNRGEPARKLTLRTSAATHLIALEPRMMFDGAGVVTADAAVVPIDAAITEALLNPFLRLEPMPLPASDSEGSNADAASPVSRYLTRMATAKFGALLASDSYQSDGLGRGDFVGGDFWSSSRDQRPWLDADVASMVKSFADAPLVTQRISEAATDNSYIFINTDIVGYEQLASEWAGKGTVVFLDGGRDGIDQIRAALVGQENIGAIHIVSHGDQGMFWLGSTRIDSAAVAGELASSFAAIGAKLSPAGDILIYGCDVGFGTPGQGLLDTLALVTGADIAASIDDTGSILRGGDWTLENRLGVIDEPSLVAREWEGLLAPTSISVRVDSLTVRNAAGTVISTGATNFAGGRSPGQVAGATATWVNAGTIGGQAIDVRATIVSITAGANVQFDRPTAASDNPAFLVAAGTATGLVSAEIRWETYVTGTNTLISGDITYSIADIDGVGGNPNSRERIRVDTTTLSSYTLDGVTDIRVVNTPGLVTASGTQDELANPPLPRSAIKLNWVNTSQWTITYDLFTAGATQAGFSHDGDNDFVFTPTAVQVSVPRLDLDGNDSTAAGSAAVRTFVENGTPVTIGDADVAITNPVGSVQSSTVTLTNAQVGDVLSVGTLPAGITAVVDTSVAGRITVTLSGASTAAQYQTALAAVTFRNTTERPATVDRNITASFTNGTLSSNIATSTIRVIEVNDPPVAVNDAGRTTPEDTAIGGINVLVNDTDGDGDALTVTAATATNGTVTIGAGGVLTYTPNADFNGTDTITYTISDGRGGTSTATVPITVTAVNDGPTAVGTLPPRANVDAASGISVATAAAFADVDGPTAIYSATGLPAGLSINSATGEITGTINRSASQTGGGVYSVVVTRSDGSLSATQAFTWTVTNPAPLAVNDATLAVNEDTAGTTVNVLANDSDPDGDPLTITSASATNGTVVINAGGTLTFTPNANYNGPATITYTISDGQGGISTATVPVTIAAINDAPTPVGSLPPRSNVDAASAINVPTATGFSDIDNAALAYSATGLPAGLLIDSATGAITGTIDRSASQGGSGGVYNVVVTASDGALSTSQSFSWTITNPAPLAVNDTASTSEDVPIPSIDVRANDSDPDGDPFTVTAASAANGTVSINPDGTLRYTPNANFNGTDTITYTISDGQGGTSTATVTVTVAAVNDAPTPVGSLPPQTNVDAAGGINVPISGAFTDVDNATLTYSATGLPSGLSINSATGVISGTIDRSASQGGTGGVYNVVVNASDGGLSTTQAFSWTISNPGPVAVNDTATTNEDAPVLISVLPNDSDPDGDTLTLIAAAASVGQATIVGNQINYVPPANFKGSATITYTISDGQGGTATATVTVTVNSVNDVPTATPIAPVNTTDGAVVSVAIAANFSDADGDMLSFVAAGLPPGLTIDPATGVISGTIDKAASQANGGVYTATITVSDGNGGTVTQTITFNVTNPPPVAVNDSASGSEDTPVTISPLVNDTDPDGDPLTITSASAPNGTVTINANGSVTYTPNPGFNGTDTITYEISDGNGGTSLATITVAVANVNDTPTSSTIANQTNLDAQIISLPVAGAFSDPDGDTLSYTATGLPAGLTINAATGEISGTIDNSASQAAGGVYTITVTASDGRGGTASTAFNWTVTNPTPTASNDAVATDEDTPVRVPVLANDTDPDGDVLRVVSASAGNGTVTINPDGSLLYTPNANFNGEDTIIYQISDGEGGFSSATATITVRPVNDAPTTVGLPNQNGDDGATVSVPTASAFSDIDGDLLTFSATGLPPALTIDPVTGVISGMLAPETSQNGPYIVSVTATDPDGRSVTTQFVYSVQNIPPVAVNDTANTTEDVPVTVAVLTNDSDPDGDPLTITAASANNGTVVINANGTLTFMPAPDFNGTALVSYTISDGNGGNATATLTVNVAAANDAPTSVAIPNVANLDNQSVSVNVGDFFSDKDGDTLSITATGLPAGLSINPTTGIISGTIDRNASQPNNGVYSVTITATDPGGLTTSRTFSWTVTNPAPTAANDSATTAEDTPATITVLTNDTDPDGDLLTVINAIALNGTVSINLDGTLLYTPNANYNGSDTITYVISDGNGGTSTAAVNVTVTPVNDAPVAVNDVATTNEDTPVTFGVLGNDADVDGDTLTVTTATSPNGTVVINPDGTLTFTPAANFNGPTTISYAISDGKGGTSTATVNITVDAVNDAPVANSSTATTPEDTPVVVPVLANDTDLDGDALTVTAATAPNGTVVINANGTVTYTPNANFNGTDTITYTISDGKGGFSTSTVVVTVGAANDAPTVTPIAPQSDNDADVVNVSVAGNFSDLDGDPLSFSAIGLPPGLSISATGIISGTIDRAASQTNGGVYSVTVTASDGNGGTVSNTFTWMVDNPAPVATNDSAATNEDVAVVIAVPANDTDPDGDRLTVVSATAPNGIVVINPDGTITYTPNANFNGTDTVTYTISDGNGGISTAIVTVAVAPTNDAPIVDTPLANISAVDGAAQSIPVAGNFTDLDGDTLSFVATGLPLGLSIDPVTGVISGTIDKNASQLNGGVYTVFVTASDGSGGTVTTSFVYTVTNPAPVAVNDMAATTEDNPVIVAVLANDSDPDADPLTVTSATAPNGTVVINPDGTITYTPNANFNGTDAVTYAISDGNGGTSTATVTITVSPLNDAPVVGTPLSNQNNPDADTVSVSVASNFSDLDGDTITFTATGLPPGLSINAAGTITGTIEASASQTNGGVYTVNVTASDGNGGSVATSFTWTVTNPAPSAVNDVASTTEEAQSAPINVLANDSDPDGDPLTVVSAAAANGTVLINPDGTLVYTPNANFNGTDTITYAISDGNGGSSTATVTVTVAAANDAPTTDSPLPNLANLDAEMVSIPVADSFSDLDGNTLTFSATGLPPGLTINAAGVISGTIDRTASQIGGGVYSVTVTANDGNGGTATSTFTWTVSNPGPNAAIDIASTNEDTLVNIVVLANDSDPDMDPLTVTAASAQNGTVVIKSDGTIDYTPNSNFNGTDTVTYTISDGNGGTSQATATVTIGAANDAPLTVGLPDAFDVNSAAISVPVGPAFRDVDGDTLSFAATGLPAGLTINAATGVISGTISPVASIGGPGNNGVYSVTVTASDGNGGTVATTFTWTIRNVAPNAVDDSYTTPEDTAVIMPVLANDTDPNLNPLTVVSATATHGSAVINGDNTITFIPDADFNGTATVIYRISDGLGGFSTATATITITAVNDAPDGSPTPAQTNLDGELINEPFAGYFTDKDGDVLTYSAANLPAGLSINQTTGAVNGNIGSGASQINGGVYVVEVTATDPGGLTTTQSFIWTVTNPGPTANDDTASTSEDAPVDIAVLANDNDPDGDTLVVTAASATNGTVTIGAGGLLTYTPDANFNGTDTITYTISDGNGGTSQAIVTINVTGQNDAPTVTALPARANVDSAVVSIPTAGSFTDVDGDTLTFTAIGLPLGLSIDAAGVISGTIDRAASQSGAGGIYTVTVTANDGNGGTVSSTFAWTVNNPPPVAADDAAFTSEDVDVDIAVLPNDSDPDGDPLTVSSASAGNGSVAIGAGGVLTYTPAANFNGTDTITYTISDGNGGTSTATVTVTVGAVNDAPVVTPIASRTNPDSATVSVPVAGNFSDLDGGPLLFSAAGLPVGLTIDPATGVISGTIDRNASQPGGGIYTVTVTANDGAGGITSTSFTWTITNPPPVALIDVASTPEDFPVNIDVLANDSDPDGDNIRVTTANAANGTVVINLDGTIDYTPALNFNGTDTITYTITDGNGGTATATVTVTVGAVNDPPVATDDASSTDEDTPVTIAVLDNDTDIDGDALTVDVSPTALNGTVTINANGDLVYTPDANFNGTDLITYQISDGKGGLDTATVTVVVRPVNDPPVAEGDSATTSEDTPVTIDVLGNDSDLDGDPLAVTAATSPDGQVTINPDGTVTFTPNANFNGTTTVTYTISDGNGGTATATVMLTVAAVNDPPVANPSISTTDEDTPVILAVLANDTDADGNPLTVSAASAANGTLAINADGTVTYTPNPNFYGVDTVTYSILDRQGGTSTSTVTVTVNSVNDVPVAANDMATTPEDAPVTIAVLGNDTDADGDPLTVTIATSPDGTVAINPDGTITFTPNPNFNGATTITYTIIDGNGGTSTATVAVTVTPVNDPPVARADTGSTPEDTPVRLSPLANDSDVDGNPLTIVTASSPNGTVVINPDGTITYTPNANFNGTDVITYQISDGNGGFDTATIAVTVAPVNDPPVAANDVIGTDEETPVRIPVLANDVDADGDPLKVTAATAPNGTVAINPDGTITYTPRKDFFGVETITYTISDGNGGTSTASVTVNVRDTNEPPVDGDETVIAIGGAPQIIDVLTNASDPEGNLLSVFAAKVDVGSVVINADGTLTYLAPPEFQGVATITYIISDGRGGFVESNVTVNVTQSTADINALLGTAHPDFHQIDRNLRPFESVFNAPLIIIDAVNDIRSLNGTADINVPLPMLTAVNSFSWLKGTTSFDIDGHPVDGVNNYIDRIRDLRFGADRLFDPRFGDFFVKGLTGFSVRQLDTGQDQVMIESVVRDRVIYMEARDIGAEGDPRMVEYQLRMRDGSPLPEWIHMDSRGLAIIERPVDAEIIRLIVRAIRADGQVVEIPVQIQGATGEIQLDKPLNGAARIGAAPLGEVMALAQASAANETARLLAAFNG